MLKAPDLLPRQLPRRPKLDLQHRALDPHDPGHDLWRLPVPATPSQGILRRNNPEDSGDHLYGHRDDVSHYYW